MSFAIIAAIGKNMELGAHGDLVWHLPEDLKFFRDTTLGHKVLMGYKTWESLPSNGLPGRECFVLSRSTEPLQNKGNTAPKLVANLQEFIQQYAGSEEEIFVIGGGSVYRQMIDYCDKLYLTEIDASSTDADVFFPTFDKTNYVRHLIKEGKDHDLTYAFVQYTKK